MNTTAVPYTFESKNFRRNWLLADLLGILIGTFLIAYGIVAVLDSSILPEFERAGYALVVGGILAANILVGLGEHLVLRRHLKLNTGWFRACVIGPFFLALFWVLLMINPSIYPFEDLSVMFRLVILNDLLLILITTFLQWRILRKIVPHAGNWFWMRGLSFIGYLVFWYCAIFFSFFLFLGASNAVDPNLDQILLISVVILTVVPQILSGVVQGIISGTNMQRLLQEPVLKVESNTTPGETTPGSRPEGG